MFALSVFLLYAGETQICRDFRCQKALHYDFRKKHTSNCAFLDGVVNVTGASLEIIPKNHTSAVQIQQSTPTPTDTHVPPSDSDSVIHVRLNATTPTYLLNELRNIRYTLEIASKVSQHKITYNGFTESSGYLLCDNESDSLTRLLKVHEAPSVTNCSTSVFSNISRQEQEKSAMKQSTTTQDYPVAWDFDIKRSLFRTDIKGAWEVRVFLYQMKSSIDTGILQLLEIDPNTPALKNEKVLVGRIVIPFHVL
ncbi:hypothetical protein XU18_0721 [Perkinsela sp. CCAP 1560/4]|nr:hypothetical protein XU18_2455 [Perkinsela sp. CCAP 1560/4]KNH08866.1 hypothetical protein XU18_0721 [Perkinsela sp. CCAP 1560/4]|eukprot:KNH06747.1 hypothetical protein XU18_2455 [Perkinsela sp. CCAP 1560/4]